MKAVANAKTVGVRGKFEDGQFEEGNRLDLGSRYDAFEHRNKPDPVKAPPIFGDRQNAMGRFNINEQINTASKDERYPSVSG